MSIDAAALLFILYPRDLPHIERGCQGKQQHSFLFLLIVLT